MEEQPKQIMNPEHISYREYKKRLSKNPHQSLILFISAFFILLLAFLGCAKLMSPDVDIAIGDEPEVTFEEEGIVRGNVDSRLKKIQDEDNKTETKDTIFDKELDEKVVIPDKKEESEPLQVQEETPVVLEHEEPAEPPKEQKQEPAPAPTPETASETQVKEQQATENIQQTNSAPVPAPAPKTYKVYIGSYSSAAQAEVAKGIIAETGLGLNVFVKNLNGSYTLQAGSFSAPDKAQSVADDLLKNNFPARVVAE